MATEYDDTRDWAFFVRDSKTLTNANGFANRWSEQVLAALRAAGVLDNMVDSVTPPTTDKLWLDKNTDPAVLKQWDATGSSWVPMTYNRLFGQAALGVLAVTGGTGNAVVVAQPNSEFQANRLYTISPTATNAAGAVTIQVSGVGTYPVKYGDGSNPLASEFSAGRQATLLFDGSVFTVLFSVGDLNAAVTAAAASASAASTSAGNAATSATNAANAATAVITGATDDDTIDDTDKVIYKTGTTVKASTFTGFMSSLFKTAHKIANAYFLSSFRLWDATDNTKGLAFNLAGFTTGTTRTLTPPDKDATLGISLGASVATTSGTSIDLTSVPSWANRVTLNFNGVSTNGTSDVVVQLGSSGGVEATGYAGTVSRTGASSNASSGSASTTYANLLGGDLAATDVLYGKVTLDRVSGNTWTITGDLSRPASTTFKSTWNKTVSAALDRIRLTTAGGANTFDAGSVSVSWEP